jgi:succinyl-CoA synthetase beta subunit
MHSLFRSLHTYIPYNTQLYLAIVLDRASSAPVIIASQRGGVDIEAVAHEDPDAIIKVTVDIDHGVTDEQARGLAKRLGCEGAVADKIAREIIQLYELFVKCDATQVEINPLAISGEEVICLDAKINFDDSAAPRQKEIFSWQDPEEVDAREAEASTYGLNYISLDGNIGSLVNGSGLAMSTMDMISVYGGQPANFCDLGGGANEESVTAAFRLVTSDPKVQAVLVNIFGGIVKCDTIANGVLAAIRNTDLKVPLVVRLAGTNAAQGKKILDDSGIKIITAGDLDTAARLAVEATAGGGN